MHFFHHAKQANIVNIVRWCFSTHKKITAWSAVHLLHLSKTGLVLVERKAFSGSLLELPPLLHWMLLFSIKDVDIVCLVVQKNSFIIFNILSQQRVCPWHGIALQLVALASLENFLLPILSFLCSCHLSAAPYFYILLTN